MLEPSVSAGASASAGSPGSGDAFLEFRSVGQVFATRRGPFEALRDINLQVR